MGKLLCVPVLEQNGWESPLAEGLCGSPLLALIDETGDPTFRENPFAKKEQLTEGEAVPALADLSLDAVIAADADDDVVLELSEAGIAVLEAPDVVLLADLRDEWRALDLEADGCCCGEDGEGCGCDSEEGGCCGGHGHDKKEGHEGGCGCGGH